MLLGLTRWLSIYLFCSRKKYAGNTCLVISTCTLMDLSKARIPISREAWLKVAFASPFRNLYMNMYLWGPILICLSRQATLQMILICSRGGWSHEIHCHDHQGCNDTWSLCTCPFHHLFKQPVQVDDKINQGRQDPYFVLENFHLKWFLYESILLLSLQFSGSSVTMPYVEIGASFQQ